MDGLSKFIKCLGSNDKTERDETLESLKKFIKLQKGKGLEELELMKLWKGLFYCMWMSDKRPVQLELASNMASLLPLFRTNQAVHQFMVAFIRTMRREWQGLDNLRVDKYYTLIRKFVGGWFRFLRDNDWSEAVMNRYKAVMLEEVMIVKPDSLRCHVLDVFVPELEKIAIENKGEGITKEVLEQLLDPLYSTLRNGLHKDISKPFYSHMLKNPFKAFVTASQLQYPGFEINLGAISREIFDIAADAEVSSSQRTMLYGLHKELRAAAKKQGTFQQSVSNGKKIQATEDEKRVSEVEQTGGSGDRRKRQRTRAAAEGQSSRTKGNKEKQSSKESSEEVKGRPRRHVSTLKDQQRSLSSPSIEAVAKSSQNGKKTSSKGDVGKLEKDGGAEATFSKSGSKRKRRRKGAKSPKEVSISTPTKSSASSKRIRFSLENSGAKTYSKSVKELRTTPIKASAEQDPPAVGLLRNTGSNPQRKPQRTSLKHGLKQARENAFKNAADATPIRVNLEPWAL